MGRRFPGTGDSSTNSANAVGEFNEYEIYSSAGTYTWTKPANLTGQRIRVYVWGAGGCGNDHGTPIGQGGGGGGLAIKYINVGALNSTESIIIGAGSQTKNGIGGTSSFGSHCSATGGNSGANQTDNQGLAVYSAGGIGIGGDINRRGGIGGYGYNGGSTDAGGGGGGSAPSPSGLANGYKGGDAISTRSAGGGGGIGGNGGDCSSNAAGGGGGSLTGATGNAGVNAGGTGGAGILGPGGSGGVVAYHYASYGGGTAQQAMEGGGSSIITPNQIIFGGGGGGGGFGYTQSTYSILANGANGGPGAGGGGAGVQPTTALFVSAGNGGILGGGGGAAHYCYGGRGGNAGGGGGNGYGGINYCGKGGDGLVIIQYRVS